MFTSLVTALAAVASVSALVVPRATPPKGWRADILEPYDAYHTRYMALGCQNKHNQPFFDLCCHPLKTGETLATARDPSCDPSKASSSTSAAAVKPTQQPSNEDDDDDDLPDCDDEDEDDDDSQTPVPTPTKAPQTTKAPQPTKAPTTPKADNTPAPKPSVTVKPTTSKAASTPKPTSGSSNTGGGSVSGGFATFFYQNGVAGACGTVHKDTDFVAAMDYRRYGNLSVKSSLCGKQVRITNTKNGKSVTVTVADACPTCDNSNSIDLSTGAFNQIATPAEGEVPITWDFI